jgi:hypothetical protein
MPIEWMFDLREAHAILVEQGSVVSTHSLDRFIWDGRYPGTSSRGRIYLSYRVGWIAYGNWGRGISAIDLGKPSNNTST